MKEITLTIDEKSCKGTHGDTILEVARRNEIRIPTLCHLKGLTPTGSCRICIVELEGRKKGHSKLVTSCTTLAGDGMIIHTRSERVMDYRRRILELFFAGRNHFCMYCSQSGNCELQDLAIEYGIDSIRYPLLFKKYDIDNSNAGIQIDHNRCILCERCVRECSEKVGANVLAISGRGDQTRIVADFGKVLGEADMCVNCGACAQVCPTGAITIRDLANRVGRSNCNGVTESICPLCSMNCRINVYTQTGSIERIEGARMDTPDGGQLCHRGRWDLLRSTEQKRISTPMIREGSTFREASWDEAIELATSKFREAHRGTGALISNVTTNENYYRFSHFFKDVMKVNYTDVLEGDIIRGFVKGFQPFDEQNVRPFTAAHHILDSDLIVTVGANPQKEAPVVASYIRVSSIDKGTRVINISSRETRLLGLTTIDMQPSMDDSLELINTLSDTLAALYSSRSQAFSLLSDSFGDISENEAKIAKLCEMDNVKVKKIVELLQSARRPIFVIGREMIRNPKILTALANLAIHSGAFFMDGLGIVPLISDGNCLGAINTVLSPSAWDKDEGLDFLYVTSGGLVPEPEQLLKTMSRSRFVVVQSPCHIHPMTNMADILLPAPAWYEQNGHLYSLETECRELKTILPPRDDVKELEEIFELFAKSLGVPYSPATVYSCPVIYRSTIPPEKAQTVEI